MKSTYKQNITKTRTLIIALFGVLTLLMALIPHRQPPPLQGTVTLTGTRFLFPLLEKWAEEFKKLHPEVNFVIQSGIKEYDINASAAPLNLAKVNDVRYTVVSRFGLLPIVNEKNPVLTALQKRGISRQDFLQIYFKDENKTENFTLNDKQQVPIHVYSRGACASATLSRHFGKEISDLNNIGGKIEDDQVLLESVKKDTLGIAYNNLGFIYDLHSRKQKAGIRVVPVDLNDNGKIDKEEKFYHTLDELVARLENNPSDLPPTGNLTFIYKPEVNPAVKAFIEWVAKEGQSYTHAAGFLKAPKQPTSAQAQNH